MEWAVRKANSRFTAWPYSWKGKIAASLKFQHGEGQDVRHPVDPAEIPVHLPDPLLPGYKKVYLRIPGTTHILQGGLNNCLRDHFQRQPEI